jgi:hypothetical protein
MRSLFGVDGFTWRTPALLCGIGVLYCVLNAFKPIQIDDAAYYYFARQMQQDPLNPYGFLLLWYDVPNQANGILAPPLLPYTWALALRILDVLHLGDSPVLCKLLLLPWPLVLVFGLHALFRRFAEGWALPLTVFTVFSPTLLPSLNLMLDVPALGLTLWSIYLFLRACDEDDIKRAVMAGLMAGLAIQTKYTGLVAPAVMVLGGALFGRWRLIPAAVLTTAQVFVCWELLMALGYDRSHFFNTASGQSLMVGEGGPLAKLTAFLEEKQVFLPVLFTLVGSVAPALIVLGLAALGLGRRLLVVIAVMLYWGILAIAMDYKHLGLVTQQQLESVAQGIHFVWEFKLSDAIFLVYGVGAFAVLTAIAVQLLWLRPSAPGGLAGPGSWKQTIFLLLWLAVEVAFYFPLTPFPAVRRVLGFTVVATLLTGQLLAQTCQTLSVRRNVQVIVAGGVVLGLAYFALDFWNARSQHAAANEAADWIQARGGTRVWYMGHWGFQYYAEHRGMKPVFDYHYRGERINAGDYLVAPDQPHNQQSIQLDKHKLIEEHVIVEEDWFPLRTVVNYYGGTAALEHHEGPRLTVRIYRVVEGFDPEPIPAPP